MCHFCFDTKVTLAAHALFYTRVLKWRRCTLIAPNAFVAMSIDATINSRLMNPIPKNQMVQEVLAKIAINKSNRTIFAATQQKKFELYCEWRKSKMDRIHPRWKTHWGEVSRGKWSDLRKFEKTEPSQLKLWRNCTLAWRLKVVSIV